MDGHSTHVSVGLIEWAKEHRIILYILPAHTSHLLQPLNVGCYGPLQRVYNNECHKQMRLTSSVITRHNVGELASRAYTKALSPENLQTAFQKTGIYPLKAAAIDPLTLAPAEVFKPVDIPEPITNSGDAPESETVTEAPNFFDSREVSLVQVKTEKEATRKPRRCLSKIVSGRCITESDVETSVREHVAASKRKPNAESKKATKKSKSSKGKQSEGTSSSQIAGPSGVNVSRAVRVPVQESQSDDSEPLETSGVEIRRTCRTIGHFL